MGIIIDGEKYACGACLKGHRVSTCTHEDRPLFHVLKKGRPVTQCQHCRAQRTARSSHVKCICAELGINKTGLRMFDDRRCTCMQGSPCTCSLKRELSVNSKTTPPAKAPALNVPPQHRRAYSQGKPALPSRRAENLVPRPQAGSGLYPAMSQQINNATPELNLPYGFPQFSASTPNLDLFNGSDYSSDNMSPHMSLPRLLRTPVSKRPRHIRGSQSYDTNGSVGDSSAHSSPSAPEASYPTTYMAPPEQQHMLPNLTFTADIPTRHSVPDFGNLNVPTPHHANFPYMQHSHSTSMVSLANSANDWNGADSWNPVSMPTAPFASENKRSSMASDHHPGLTHSPSITASDYDSSALLSEPTLLESTAQVPSGVPDTINPAWMLRNSSEDYTNDVSFDWTEGTFGPVNGSFSSQTATNAQIMDNEFLGNVNKKMENYLASSDSGITPSINSGLHLSDNYTNTFREPSSYFDDFYGSEALVEPIADLASIGDPFGPTYETTHQG